MQLLCDCHHVPLIWNKDPQDKHGGFWRCRVRLKEHTRRWEATPSGRERKRERDRVYRQRHAEAISERRRIKRAENPEPNRQRVREWAQANPDRARALSARTQQRRRARKAHVVSGPWTRDQVWLRDEGRCWICGGPLSPENWHVDHVIPISRGGPDTFENVRAAHPACNIRKGARL